MTIMEFAQLTGCKILTSNQNTDNEITGCFMCDLLSYVMGKAQRGDAWITIMTNVNVVAVAILAEVACVIVPDGNVIEQQTIDKANDNEIVILSTDLSAYQIGVQLSKYLEVH